MYSDYQGRAPGRAVRGRGQQRDQEGEEDGKEAPAGRVRSAASARPCRGPWSLGYSSGSPSPQRGGWACVPQLGTPVAS